MQCYHNNYDVEATHLRHFSTHTNRRIAAVTDNQATTANSQFGTDSPSRPSWRLADAALTMARLQAAVVLAAVAVISLGLLVQHKAPNTLSLVTFLYDMIYLQRLGPSDGREQRLLAHVKATTQPGDAQAVLSAIDGYAWGKEFFMNVGDEKGRILSEALANLTAVAPPKNLLELGSYCGYSGIRMMSALQQHDAKLYTVDVYEPVMKVAAEMFAHAGVSKQVEQVKGPLSNCTQALRDKGMDTFDFVFLDHIKEYYVSDLKLLRDQGFLHDGTVVVADNLAFPGAPDYIAFMEAAPDFEYTPFHLHAEYTIIPDIIGVSVYRPNMATSS